MGNVTSNPGYKLLADSQQGFFDFDGGNETRTRSKYNDAAKHRIGGPQGGTLSFDVVEGDPTDPNARATEVAYLGGGLSDFTRDKPGNRTGMLTMVIRDESIPARADGNEDPKEVVAARFYVGPLPEGQEHVQLIPEWVASLRRQVGGGSASTIGEGDYVLHVQGDGNVVVYQKNGSADPAAWTAVYNRFDWDAWRARATASLAALGQFV